MSDVARDELEGVIERLVDEYTPGDDARGVGPAGAGDAAAPDLAGRRSRSPRMAPETVDREKLKDALDDDAMNAYDEREEQLGEELMRYLERSILLQVIDNRWREHLYDMDYLREGIHLRGFAQIDPLVAYKNEGFAMFEELMHSIWEEFSRLVFHAEIEVAPAEAEQAFAPAAGPSADLGGTPEAQPSADQPCGPGGAGDWRGGGAHAAARAEPDRRCTARLAGAAAAEVEARAATPPRPGRRVHPRFNERTSMPRGAPAQLGPRARERDEGSMRPLNRLPAGPADAAGESQTSSVADVQVGGARRGASTTPSRGWGSMFFANPVAALRNVRAALAPAAGSARSSGGASSTTTGSTAPSVRRRRVPRRTRRRPTSRPAARARSRWPTPTRSASSSTIAGFEEITLQRCDLPLKIGDDLDHAVEFDMALGPAGEVLRLWETGRRDPAEIAADLREAWPSSSGARRGLRAGVDLDHRRRGAACGRPRPGAPPSNLRPWPSRLRPNR